MNFLVVEDDFFISEAVKDYLESNFQNSQVNQTFDGFQACDILLENSFDLIILDISLPKANGFEIIEFIKKSNIECKIICLSAKNQTKDVVRALKIGADDYLKKPFDFEELKYRIVSLMRQLDSFEDNEKIIDGWNYSYNNQELTKVGQVITLTNKENLLLSTFIKNRGQFLSSEILIDLLWSDASCINEKNLKVHISFLRRKIEINGMRVQILNKKGLGYKLIENEKRN